jgi:co-chaperonin GroES (HSP10)
MPDLPDTNKRIAHAIPRALRSQVFVKVRGEYRDSLTLKSGLKLHIDPMYNPGSWKFTSGEVVSTPHGRSRHFISSRIDHKVRVGDKIYFHYNSLDPFSRVDIPGRAYSEFYYSIPYDMIFCIVRQDGSLDMVGGRILVSAMEDNDGVVTLENGTKVRKNFLGLITELNVKHHVNKAVVEWISLPLDGEPIADVKRGDVIYFVQDSDFAVVIEDKVYWCMTHDDIVGVYK